MKANQAFKQSEEAVSPVIGVILMVAITVVLAAVVFVLVSNLSKNSSSSTPSVSFSQDAAGKKVSLISADATADWKNVKATTTDSSTHCVLALTHGATVVTPIANGGIVSGGSGTSILMGAGDYLQFTQTAGFPAGEICTVSLTYVPSNSLLGSTYSFTFA